MKSIWTWIKRLFTSWKSNAGSTAGTGAITANGTGQSSTQPASPVEQWDPRNPDGFTREDIVIAGYPRCWLNDPKTGGAGEVNITFYVADHGGITEQWRAHTVALPDGRHAVPVGYSIGTSAASAIVRWADGAAKTCVGTGSNDRIWYMIRGGQQ